MGHLIRTPGGHCRRQTTEWTWGALFPHQLIVFYFAEISRFRRQVMLIGWPPSCLTQRAVPR